MEKIMANVWGKQEEVTLTTWSEIRKLGFKTYNRSFGNLNDGTPALYYNGGKMFPSKDGFLPNDGKDEWFLTTEKLDEINEFEKKELQSTVKTLFKEKNMNYDFYITKPYTVHVEVEWGDWKHDHLRLKQIMEQNGFSQTDERLTEEDGSDCYSAEHIYMKK